MTKSPTDIAAELERLAEIATPGPWNIYRQDCPTYDDIVNELLQQFALTKPTIPALVMLEAGGKCPALTGCGPTSAANAALIQAYRNHHATILAALRAAGEVERMREALEEIDARTNSFALGSPMQLINAIARRALAGRAT